MSRSRPWLFLAVAVALELLVIPASTPRLSAADSEAEEAIKNEIKDFADARNKGDLTRVLSHVADNANMVSFAGRNQTKTEYGASVKTNMGKFAHLERTYRVVEMNFPDATHAVALVQQDEYSTQGLGTGNVKMKLEETNRVEWKLEKRSDKWLIVGQKWLK